MHESASFDRPLLDLNRYIITATAPYHLRAAQSIVQSEVLDCYIIVVQVQGATSKHY
jgi:hypothetical protein